LGITKAMLRGKFIAIVPTLKKKRETSQINNLMMHLKLLEKNKNEPNPNPADGET
jgi:hypothetical protein